MSLGSNFASPPPVPLPIPQLAGPAFPSSVGSLPEERGLTSELVSNMESLISHLEAWQALADNPLERNVFYEPWMLVPAIRAFSHSGRLRVLFIFRGSRRRELVGVFPLQYHLPRCLPFAVISLWRHPHCFLCTPLLYREVAAPIISFVLEKLLAEYSGRVLIAFRTISGDGPFYTLLKDEIARRRLLSVCETHARPIVRVAPKIDEYLSRALSGHRRRAMLRRERKLAAIGKLTCQTKFEDVNPWMTAFLQMEGSGWKGRNRSALNSTKKIKDFFTSTVSEGHRRGKLMPISLLLDGRPLAHRLSFISGDEAFAFKSTYDENYAQYSPGILLELANLRHLHFRTDIRLMDSCTASPEHSPMNGMWREQRTIHTIFMTADTQIGRLLCSVLPGCRAIQKKICAPLIRR